jgi:ketosteroid isomerase-like protein
MRARFGGPLSRDTERAMSQENAEIVRGAFEAWNSGDLEAFLSRWSEGAEFYPLRAQLEGHPYHGHEGLRRFVAEIAEEWSDVRFEIHELRGTGERVIALGRFRARGRTSGLDLNVPLGAIGTVRNDRIVYARMFSDPADALEAAGLRE